jgi:hypothetical protein
MVKKYTDAQVLQQYLDWIDGTISRRETPMREWSAMKRRINRAGLIKRPEHFKASSKGRTNLQWKSERARIARDRYSANKLKSEDTIVAVGSKDAQRRPTD